MSDAPEGGGSILNRATPWMDPGPFQWLSMLMLRPRALARRLADGGVGSLHLPLSRFLDRSGPARAAVLGYGRTLLVLSTLATGAVVAYVFAAQPLFVRSQTPLALAMTLLAGSLTVQLLLARRSLLSCALWPVACLAGFVGYELGQNSAWLSQAGAGGLRLGLVAGCLACGLLSPPEETAESHTETRHLLDCFAGAWLLSWLWGSLRFVPGLGGEAPIGPPAAQAMASWVLVLQFDWSGLLSPPRLASSSLDAVAGVLAFLAGYRHFVLYPLEALVQAGLDAWQGSGRGSTLHLTPALEDESIAFPLPFLLPHLVATATTRPDTVRRVLQACDRSPALRSTACRARRELQARELGKLLFRDDLERLRQMQYEWLPEDARRDPMLMSVAEVAASLARHHQAATGADRLQELEAAERSLKELWARLGSSDEHAVFQSVASGLEHLWQKCADDARLLARADGSERLRNPFQAGEPLSRERGESVFRGREAIVSQLEALLDDARTSASIALLGPRRSGKTSLLQMLPALLSDTVCIFFDLQDNRVDTSREFFRSLAARGIEQAARDRGLQLPALPPGGPFVAGREWFRALEALPGDFRILICLDEFEGLEPLFAARRQELLQIMGLFRATIQHGRKLRILVAGEAPFEELGTIWDDHFINLREIRLGHLEWPSARALLTRPVPDFPAGTIPEPVAWQIFYRTGGQPFLLQLYGRLLVQLLNESARHTSTVADLELVEEQVLTQVGSYFRDTWQQAPPGPRTALEALARGESPALDARTERWLRNRCLLAEYGKMNIPVLGRAIVEELELAA